MGNLLSTIRRDPSYLLQSLGILHARALWP
jgi:hypothetical protein